tara:strand:- start:6116 stop:6364 length:249 start_codon:yes stop_codon:yes gene_type:complete
MSKPISNAKFRSIIKSLPAEKQRETLERELRILPHFLMEEVARVPQLPASPKVIKYLESRLKCARILWTEYLVENHVNKETV